MVKRHGWVGGVVLTFLAAMVWMLLPGPASAGEAKNVTSNFDVRIGGYVQMNVTWDSDESDDAVNNMRANATADGSALKGRETIRATAARTRLITDVRGPEVGGGKTRAYVEIDFDGFKEATASDHADTPRLRRAYLRYDWPSLWLLIGQDTMLFTSAVGSESEISGTTSGGRGDITGGSRNRTPQFKLGVKVPAGPAKFELIGSVAHNGTGRGDPVTNQDNDSGARAKIPALTAMGQLTVPVAGRDLVLAGSYIFMQEKLLNAAGTDDQNVASRGVAIEAILPLGPATPIGSFEARGNYFWGENLSRVSLGNNGGVTTTTCCGATRPSEISAWGWWAEGNWALPMGLHLGGGYGRLEDDVNDIRVQGGTRIETNHGMWVFVKYTTGPIMHFIQYSDIETVRLVTGTDQRLTTDSQEVHYVARYRF